MAGESRGSADDGGEGIGGGWAENRGERRGETAGGYRFTRRPCFANRDGGRRLQRRKSNGAADLDWQRRSLASRWGCGRKKKMERKDRRLAAGRERRR
ncbi:hypothetical protein CSA_017718 [Cucumis sativus]|uniref:Uncharacterized protein n=1 Tax=Cucumis sativus TaxID=3659 RepID=A0ACB6HBH9_CUCSA|nr:hypothetical protein CSA_017718 [Cucumis sativus]